LPKIKNICKICGQEFEYYKRVKSSYYRVTCSSECSLIHAHLPKSHRENKDSIIKKLRAEITMLKQEIEILKGAIN